MAGVAVGGVVNIPWKKRSLSACLHRHVLFIVATEIEVLILVPPVSEHITMGSLLMKNAVKRSIYLLRYIRQRRLSKLEMLSTREKKIVTFMEMVSIVALFVSLVLIYIFG